MTLKRSAQGKVADQQGWSRIRSAPGRWSTCALAALCLLGSGDDRARATGTLSPEAPSNAAPSQSAPCEDSVSTAQLKLSGTAEFSRDSPARAPAHAGHGDDRAPAAGKPAPDGAHAPAHAGQAEDRVLAARTLLRAGHYARVEGIARTLLAEAEESKGRDSIESARAIDLLVAALVRSGKARDAETGARARRAVALKERTAGSDQNELAASLYGLAEQLRMSGAYAEARSAYERALAIRGGAGAARSPGRASDEGSTSAGSGGVSTPPESVDRSTAVARGDHSASARSVAGEPDTVGLVELLRGYGAFLLEAGEYAKVRSLLDSALAATQREFGPEDPHVALVLVDIARLLLTTGNYVDGRPLLDRALVIQERTIGPDHLETAYTLRELGELLRLSGDYAAARPPFDRALAIREKALGPDHLEVADALKGLGVLLRRTEISKTHNCPQAYPVCARAFAIAEKTLGPDHPLLARYLDGFAWAVFQCEVSTVPNPAGVRRSIFGRARDLFERSLAIHEKTFGPDHPACLEALGGMASTTLSLGQPDRSIPWFQRRLAIELRTLGRDNVQVGLTRMELAQAQANSTVITFGPELPDFRYDATSPALSAALDNALESERISREHARLTARSLPESEAHRLNAARWSVGLSITLSVCARGADPDVRLRAFDALVRSRALVLDITASRHRAILRASEPEVERLAHVLDAARGRLADLVIRGVGASDPEAYRRSLDGAQRAEKDAERALAARSAGFAAEFDRSNLGGADLIAALPADSALVAYATYFDNYRESDNSYIAFVVRSGDQAPAVIPLGMQPRIDELVAEWRRQISQAPAGGVVAEAAARAAGANLRRKIWDPIAAKLRGARRVFIVPDGALNTISFGAMPVGRGTYLLEQAPILHYLSSERDLVPDKHPSGDGLLALGGPAYDASSVFASRRQNSAPLPTAAPRAGSTFVDAATPYRGTRSMCESFQRMRFSPLPEAAKEATGLISLWSEVRRGGRNRGEGQDGTSGARELLGAQATEDAFKRLAPGNRFLHIATHGFFLGGACASALDPASNDGVAVNSLASENPLLLSGLALAGANHRSDAGPEDEDGILTAEEIAALNLTGVEWAVLSACDTASGDIRTGEGVLGLQRAFRVAGAHTVVMSLWPVDDRATRRWMQNLYEGHLRRGLDTAESVRVATLTVLADRRRKGLDTHPFHWAGFIASGDWR